METASAATQLNLPHPRETPLTPRHDALTAMFSALASGRHAIAAGIASLDHTTRVGIEVQARLKRQKYLRERLRKRPANRHGPSGKSVKYAYETFHSFHIQLDGSRHPERTANMLNRIKGSRREKCPTMSFATPISPPCPIIQRPRYIQLHRLPHHRCTSNSIPRRSCCLTLLCGCLRTVVVFTGVFTTNKARQLYARVGVVASSPVSEARKAKRPQWPLEAIVTNLVCVAISASCVGVTTNW